VVCSVVYQLRLNKRLLALINRKGVNLQWLRTRQMPTLF
jgi:hypothetical protein